MLDEDRAYETFCKLRWPATNGEPVCPKCGSIGAYKITTRRRFKCADCYAQYSVTSGTMFHSRKLAFTDILGALDSASSGASAARLASAVGITEKAANALRGKAREVLRNDSALEGRSGWRGYWQRASA